jgi:catechol 2,3-dioxygenase-like lactoylglutathione lyase family enzyme
MALEMIDFATVFVASQESSKGFCTDILGLQLRGGCPDGDGRRFLTAGPAAAGAGIALETARDDAPAGGMTGIVFGSGDVAGAYEELAARGVVFPMPPAKQEWGAVRGQFDDPDGNVFVLHEKLA